MTFGTFLPLPMFLLGYLMNVTLVGAPLAQGMYRLAVYTTTLGQEPPRKERLAGKEKTQKKPVAERIRPYSPPGRLEKRGQPVAVWLRVVWFSCVGWWLGAIWVVLSWAILLAPYPFLDTIRELLSELPSVMTLATPTPGQTQRDPAAGRE
jgi:uncharacterized membrane protein YccF (DUF307 family)